MSKADLVVRWATPADLTQFYDAHPGHEIRQTQTALVGDLDGEIIAVGGLAHHKGYLVAFYDMDEKARRYKIALVKAGKRMIGSIKPNRLVLAQADAKEPCACRWIESMGFKPANDTGLYVLMVRGNG